MIIEVLINLHSGVILEELGFLIAGKTDIIRLYITWRLNILVTMEIEEIS